MRRPSKPDDAQASLRDKIIGLGERSIRKSYYPELHRRIRELEAARQELRESQRLLQTIIDTAPIRVFWKDRNLRYLGCNPVFAADAGKRSPDEVVGQDDSQMAWADQAEAYRQDDRNVIETGLAKLAYDEPITTSDGRTTWIRTAKVPLRNQDNEIIGVLGIYDDITERKKAEEDLRRHKDQLEETVRSRTAELAQARDVAEAANKAKSAFLANMSHELRTPMNAILGFSTMMRREPGLTPSQRQNLDIINRSGEHLLHLINDVLEIAKIEAGRTQLMIAPFDLGTMVRDVADMMQLRAQEKGLQLRLDQSSKFPRFIKGDEARLRQVLVNLIGNAVKFTEHGGVTIRLGVQHHAKNLVLMEVEDTGPGISPEDQKRLFKPFVQLAEAHAQEGTGLGLALSRQYAELMGGSLGVESTPGKGSIFRVELPVELLEETEVETGTLPDKPLTADVCGLAPGQPSYRILIAEDQPDNQELLVLLMNTLGLDPKVADNGEQCVQIFADWHPHLIWMDRRMPVMDGAEATRRIRQLPGGKEVKIVGVTASVFREEQQQQLDAGLDDFVRKPYLLDEIYDCLARQLGVQYIYRSETPPTEEAPCDVSTPVNLPAPLCEELKAAIESVDSERLATAIDLVGAHDAALQTTLERLADAFDYPAILKMLPP